MGIVFAKGRNSNHGCAIVKLSFPHSEAPMSFDHESRANTTIEDRPVGRLLDNLHMKSAFYTASTFSSPWAISIPPMAHCMMFHICMDGTAEFRIHNDTVVLNTGDFILFPKGQGHELSDGQGTMAAPLSQLPIQAVTERYETLTYGGGGRSTQMVCSAMLFDHPLAIKLLGVLPEYIVIRRDDNSANTVIDNINALLSSETQRIALGAEAVISRLAEILVISAMRVHLMRADDDDMGWINALEDERIGRSLQLIHSTPDKHWGLGELASLVGMSRTSFAIQFKKLVGNTPMDYLTEWRMSLAYSRLQFSKDSVLSIALDVGYQSESAFSRAFKKVIGKSPGEVRRAIAA